MTYFVPRSRRSPPEWRSDVQIRPAARTDIPQLLPLIRRYWEFEGITGFEALRIELLLQRLLADSAAGAIWLAESQGACAAT